MLTENEQLKIRNAELTEQVETLKEALIQMRSALIVPVEFSLVQRFGVSGGESRILGALLKTGFATHRVLETAAKQSELSDDVDNNTVKVYIFKLKRKLGIDIINIKGVGYKIEPRQRKRLLQGLPGFTKRNRPVENGARVFS